MPSTATATAAANASPSHAPDLTDELLRALPETQSWVSAGKQVEYDDGSTGVIERTRDGLILTVTSADGDELSGPVPDFNTETGLAPQTLALDSGDLGYIAHQGGGESSFVTLMTPWQGTLVLAGQACYDSTTAVYEICESS